MKNEKEISHVFEIISSTIKTIIIMWRVDPLLGNDLETTSAARQQILNKQEYAAVTE
jgi:hypothetical protein